MKNIGDLKFLFSQTNLFELIFSDYICSVDQKFFWRTIIISQDAVFNFVKKLAPKLFFQTTSFILF